MKEETGAPTRATGSFLVPPHALPDQTTLTPPLPLAAGVGKTSLIQSYVSRAFPTDSAVSRAHHRSLVFHHRFSLTFFFA